MRQIRFRGYWGCGVDGVVRIVAVRIIVDIAVRGVAGVGAIAVVAVSVPIIIGVVGELAISAFGVIIIGVGLVADGSIERTILPLMSILAMSAFLPVSEIANIGRQLADTLGSTRRLHAVEQEVVRIRIEILWIGCTAELIGTAEHYFLYHVF